MSNNAYITDHMLRAIISSYRDTRVDGVPAWLPKRRYTIGEKCQWASNLYVCSQSGVSGSTPPLHTSGARADGTASWLHATTTQHRENVGTNLYLSLGGPASWKDEPNPDVSSSATQHQVLGDIATLLKLSSRDIRAGFPRINYETGKVYPMWPAQDSYVVLDLKIYRCLNNAGGAESTIEPSGRSAQPQHLSDGYVWKYLCDINARDDEAFGHPEHFPLNDLLVDDGSERWIVQQNAKNGEVSSISVLEQTGALQTDATYRVYGVGERLQISIETDAAGNAVSVIPLTVGEGFREIDRIVLHNNAPGGGAAATVDVSNGAVSTIDIVTAGSHYDQGAMVVIDGDGTGASATLNVNGGYVIGFTIDNGGQNYTWARAFIVPGDAVALCGLTLAPVGGHGSNAYKELPCNTLLVSRRIGALDRGYTSAREVRQIALVSGIGDSNRYVGPAHPDPIGKETVNLGTARVLFISNVQAFSHSSGQDDVLKLSVTLT